MNLSMLELKKNALINPRSRIAGVGETERRGEYDLAVTRATQTSPAIHHHKQYLVLTTLIGLKSYIAWNIKYLFRN